MADKALKAFKWSLLSMQAAGVLGMSEKPLSELKQEAADCADVTVRTVERWLAHKEFHAAVDTFRAEFARNVLTQIESDSIGDFETRLRELNALYRKLQKVISARVTFAKEKGQDVPGASEGLNVLCSLSLHDSEGNETTSLSVGAGIDKTLVSCLQSILVTAHKMTMDLRAIESKSEAPSGIPLFEDD